MNIDRNILRNMTTDRLRQRVVIQHPETARDEEGNRILTYNDAAEIWACIEAVAAAITPGAVETDSGITFRVTLRYGSAITKDDRIVYAGGMLRITSPPVDVAGRHAWMVLECREWVES